MKKNYRPKILLALDHYDYRIHRGVANMASRWSWSLYCNHSTVGMPSVPESWKGDGIISLIGSQKTMDRVYACDVPTVDLGLHPKVSQHIYRVVTDNHKIGELAAEHLFYKGLRSFACTDVEADNDMFLERQNAFVQHLEHLSTQHQQKIAIAQLPNTSDRKRLQDLILQLNKPLGILGYSDGQAVFYLDMALDLGLRVPEDVAVLGVDNNDLNCEGIEIPMSSVETDQIGLGEKAAHLLHVLLQGQIPPQRRFQHPPHGVHIRKSTEVLTSSHPTVRRALVHIQSKVHLGLSAKELSAAMKMSPQGLQQLFKEHDGRSPGGVIRQTRLKLAQDVLLNSEGHLPEVIEAAGYSSVDSLCRVFRKELGTTPLKWRQAHLKAQTQLK